MNEEEIKKYVYSICEKSISEKPLLNDREGRAKIMNVVRTCLLEAAVDGYLVFPSNENN